MKERVEEEIAAIEGAIASLGYLHIDEQKGGELLVLIKDLWAENQAISAKEHKYREALEKKDINLIAAANAIIGYTSSLKEGDVITKGYIERLEGYYVANLKQALSGE